MNQRLNIDEFASERGFKLITWNVRSLYRKFSEITAIIDKLDYEVLSICETLLNSSIQNSWLSLPNYNLID